MMFKQTLTNTHGLFLQCLGSLFLGLMCFLAAAQASPAVAAETEVVDRIVAVVNDEIIVLQEVNSLTKSYKEELEKSGYSDEEKSRMLEDFRESVINQLVNRKLIIQAAKEKDWLTVSESEVDASVQRYKEQYNLTDKQLSDGLEKEGLTMEDFRNQLKESSLASSLENYEVASKIVITKEDVTQYYNQHPDKYKGLTTYHLRRILIKSSTSDSAAKQEAVKAKLSKIQAEFESGVSFQDLARKYSEEAYASEGGELGNFKLSDLSTNLRTAIEPLSAGEMTQPLETSDGYQILYVQEIHKESNASLESVYKEIEDELYQQQYKERRQAWIEGLRKNAHIKIIE